MNQNQDYITQFGNALLQERGLSILSKPTVESLFLQACFREGFFPVSCKTILEKQDPEGLLITQLQELVKNTRYKPGYIAALQAFLESIQKEELQAKFAEKKEIELKTSVWASFWAALVSLFLSLFSACRKNSAIEEPLA